MIILGILLAALVIIVGYLYLHIIMAAIMTHETLNGEKCPLGELEDGN